MLDEIDRAIIHHLQYNGRLPYTYIAEKIGVSEGAVRRHIKKMIASGTLQIVGIVEPDKLGWNEAGMIGIRVLPEKTDEISYAIAQLPEVSYLFQVAGKFDLFAEVMCKDREHFVTFLNDKLQKIPGVVSTDTFLILKMYKLSYRWGHAEPPQAIENKTPE